ncbi:MAG: pyrimidine reductase family protein [Actinomycetota bacterium]|nr:pyrimidine reductase family protein [Actinomycetota bacterium]MDQ6945359.1 pyrimidine reductase family protein [Actinomycetota bacterium]
MALSLALGGPPPGPELPALPQAAIDPEAVEGLYRSPRSPWVRANMVVSLDGAVELEGRSSALGSPDDRLVFTALRALADVVLVGSGTARAENYGPALVASPARARRLERGQTPAPPVAVLTNRADLDPDARLFTAGSDERARPILLTCQQAPEAARKALAERADVVICGQGSVDLRVALEQLRARGLPGVLCEGGPTIITGLLALGAVDELCLTQAPVVAGPDHLRLVAGAPLAGAVHARLIHLLAGDDALFARYQLAPARAAQPSPSGTGPFGTGVDP